MTLIKKPFQLETNNPIRVLIYGQPGIGKTTLALSAPQPLLLDFDRGVHRINPSHQLDTVQIESWQDVLDVLKEDLSAYKTLVIDTAGKMLDYMGAYLISRNPKLGKANGVLTLQGYGERKGEFLAFLKHINMLNKHIIFVAHDKEEKGNDDNKIIRPEIGGSSGADLIRDLDLVGYMEAIGKKRTISFDPCERFYGKNTCELDASIEVQSLEAGVKNQFLSAVFTKYAENLSKRKAIAAEYSALNEDLESKLISVKDAESANLYVDFLNSSNHVWDSKIIAGIKLNATAKELGLKLNKETKKYEA